MWENNGKHESYRCFSFLFSCCFGETEGSVKNLDIINIFDSVIQIMHKAKAQIECCLFAQVCVSVVL